MTYQVNGYVILLNFNDLKRQRKASRLKFLFVCFLLCCFFILGGGAFKNTVLNIVVLNII